MNGPARLASSLLVVATTAGCGQVTGNAILGEPLESPTTLVANQLEPIPLVVDGGYVYWVNDDPYLGSLLRVPVGGGPVDTLASHQNTSAFLFAVDSTSVYFPANGALLGEPVAGGSPTTLATVLTNAVQEDATGLYLCEQLADGNGGLAVDALPVTGGAPRRLAALPGFDPVAGFVLAQGSLYVAGALQHAVATVTTSGGSPVFLDVDGRSMASDGQSLFVAVPSEGTIEVMPLGGGALTTVASGLDEPDALAADDTYVYFSTRGDPPLVSRVPKSGGAVTPLAATHTQVRAIVVDDGAVYFADPADGTVLSITPGP